MPRLHIALQEGFTHDPVAVRIDGVEIYRHTDVCTLQRSGIAASFCANVAAGDVALDIRLANRHRREHHLDVPVLDEAWLGISLRPDGELIWHTSERAPARL